LAACGGGRPAAIAPLTAPRPVASDLREASALRAPARIDFEWQLNEAGSRVRGVGVARVEPPYRARLDLFLDNGETVIAAAVVDDELRLPPGAPDDVLPPIELMWGTLGVFRPLAGATLIGGDRLDNGAERLRYGSGGGRELHYEVAGQGLAAIEVLEGTSLVEWVRLTATEADEFPASATYRNLVDFRELQIVRVQVSAVESFDTAIWDPR
jgi:hypothetical protein